MTSWIFTELTQLLGEFLRRCFVGLLRPTHPRLGLFLTGEFHFGRCWHGTPSFSLAGWWGLRPSRERTHVGEDLGLAMPTVTLLGTDGSETVSAEQIAALTPEQMLALTPEHFAAMSAEQVRVRARLPLRRLPVGGEELTKTGVSIVQRQQKKINKRN